MVVEVVVYLGDALNTGRLGCMSAGKVIISVAEYTPSSFREKVLEMVWQVVSRGNTGAIGTGFGMLMLSLAIPLAEQRIASSIMSSIDRSSS